jgi:AraC-like DNA-binding protein
VGRINRRQPGYSMRVIQAFARALSSHPAFPGALIEDLDASDPDTRIPATVAHKFLSGFVERTGEPALGLRAGCAVSLGDGGALDYAMSSAASVQDALAVAARYWPLVNDALKVRLEVDGGRACLRLDSEVILPPAAEDFLVSAFFKNHIRSLPCEAAEMEVWFVHPAPKNTVEYERSFAPASVRFGSPACGFTFRQDFLNTTLASADPKLHDVLRRHAETLLSELPTSRSVTDAVRQSLLRELAHGNPTAAHVARQLHMSPRTLERRLAGEGTTFSIVLDDLRRRLAFEYVSGVDYALSEIAFLLGFSQPAAFHRAFKRWTQQTPLEYRRSRQR